MIFIYLNVEPEIEKNVCWYVLIQFFLSWQISPFKGRNLLPQFPKVPLKASFDADSAYYDSSLGGVDDAEQVGRMVIRVFGLQSWLFYVILGVVLSQQQTNSQIHIFVQLAGNLHFSRVFCYQTKMHLNDIAC